jgi:hypothetical protein
MKIWVFVTTLTAMTLVACTPVSHPAPPAAQPAPPTLTVADDGSLVQEETIVVEKPTEGRPPMLPQVSEAIADLAGRLGVAPAQIEVVSVEAVVWPDGGLGCPQPGMMYPQVLQDGLRIQLAVDGVVYQYHSGGRRAPFLCEHPAEPAPPGVGVGGS